MIAGAAGAAAQVDLEEPILPDAVSQQDIELFGRYAQQWRQPDGTWALAFTGGFELRMGQRRLQADEAVVWIAPQTDADSGRRFFEVTAYLSGNAQVREFGGTLIEDQMLLISEMRTYGRIVKHHDAHVREPGEQSPLYQRALADRAAIESGERAPSLPPPVLPPEGEPERPAAAPRPPRVIRYALPSVEPVQTATGEQVFVARRTPQRRVYFARGGRPDEPMLEIQADSAVVFAGSELGRGLLGAEAPQPAGPPATAPARPVPAVPAETAPPGPPAEPRYSPWPEGLARNIRGVYLEGDVILSLGGSFVRASRLYYDFERDRALILDAVFRTDLPERGVPLYVRAEEIRQLSAREFLAEDARVSTSEFFTPHYHVGADRIVLRDVTNRDAAGRPLGPATGEFELFNTTLNVEDTPLLWWPYMRGRLEDTETAIRRLRVGYSGDFGFEVETAWNAFSLLGIPPPEGYDATARLDYYSERGPATGLDLDYLREDYFGLLRSYYINDGGEDNLGPLRREEEEPDSANRGRVLWRHRHYLPENWEATFELSYISDPNFLEEYRRSEFNEGKEQETLVYLKHTGETDALTLLANWRLLDFVTQTEHLPDLVYRRIGDTFLSPFVMYHESRIGMVRYRLDDRHFLDHRFFSNDGSSDLTFRTDGRQEIELPLRLADLNVVPFATFRGTYWDGGPVRDGGLWRGMGTYGARGSLLLSRVFADIESELLDIHGIRHIVQPDFVAWYSHSNARSELITPFDYGIETIDDFYGGSLGLRQTWQTKRGGAAEERIVDLATLNLEVGFFGDAHDRDEISNGYVNPWRPENSRTRNYFAGDFMYRISDTTSLLYDFNVDLNGWSYDRHNVSLAVERLPRLAYVFGYRHAGDINMDLIGGGWNYKLNEKHITTVRTWFDTDRGDLGEIAVGYVRKLPRWYVAVTCEYDRVDDDFTVSLSLWPEGIPEWAIGSRRFTGLGTTTGIRP